MTQDVDPEESCIFSVKSRKMDRVMNILTHRYAPFNQLSEERLAEVMNLVRIIEMRAGEIFQVRSGRDNDYLFVLEGSL